MPTTSKILLAATIAVLCSAPAWAGDPYANPYEQDYQRSVDAMLAASQRHIDFIRDTERARQIGELNSRMDDIERRQQPSLADELLRDAQAAAAREDQRWEMQGKLDSQRLNLEIEMDRRL